MRQAFGKHRAQRARLAKTREALLAAHVQDSGSRHLHDTGCTRTWLGLRVDWSNDEVMMVQEFYKFSPQKAKAALKVLSPEQKNIIKHKMENGIKND